jgi:hypothetical protein
LSNRKLVAAGWHADQLIEVQRVPAPVVPEEHRTVALIQRCALAKRIDPHLQWK